MSDWYKAVGVAENRWLRCHLDCMLGMRRIVVQGFGENRPQMVEHHWKGAHLTLRTADFVAKLEGAAIAMARG